MKGLNRVKKRLSDGTVKTYYYAWKGGPALPGKPGSAEFVDAYNAAVATRKAAPQKVLFSILRDFQDSQEFLKLGKVTRHNYLKIIPVIEREFGDFPLSGLSEKRSRGIFLDWRDKIAKKSPSNADQHIGLLRRILSWAVDRGSYNIDTNPLTKITTLFNETRVDKIWSEEQEATFLAKASEHLQLSLTLALWTGQREADLVALRWSQYDGTCIRLEQQKSRRNGKPGKKVVIPVGAPLKAALDATERYADTILVNAYKLSWANPRSFAQQFGKTREKVGITGVTFHDLRGTAVTRLARAGCTVPEIASITGHSLSEVKTILEAHYLLLDQVLAQNAIRKLEDHTSSPTKRPTEQPSSASV
jgi:integrase